MKKKHLSISKIGGLVELILFSGIYYYFWRNIYRPYLIAPYYGYGKYIIIGFYTMILLVSLYICDGFKFGILKAFDVTISQIICIILANCFAYFEIGLLSNRLVTVVPILVMTAIDFVLAIVLVFIYSKLYHQVNTPDDILLVTGEEDVTSFVKKVHSRKDRFQISQIINYNDGDYKVQMAIDSHEAVILHDIPAEIRNDILKYCYAIGKKCYVVPKITDILNSGAEDTTLFDTPFFMIKRKGLSFSQRFIKRSLDLFFSCLAALVLSPLFLIVMLCIKIEDGGPVFYKQDRITINHKHFDILKFRSMIVDAEKHGAQPAVDHDPRITKVGRIIRATRIDELPQIFNIIKGDMSIVGPRPERYENVDEYTAQIPEFVFREQVKAGLTGYAQVLGKYNTSAYDKLRMDLIYIQNYSLTLDIKLVFMTVAVMFKKEATEGFDNK